MASSAGEFEVRLWGVDAPERNQPFGLAAMRWLRARAEGREFEMCRMAKEFHGRIVADLADLAGSRLSVEIVRAGWAWWYRRYARLDREIADAEKEARAAKRGLWRDVEPVPPWDWRRRLKR